MSMLTDVKTALRVTTNAYDDELNGLIESAKLDLGVAGVIVPESDSPIVTTAIKTYCKLNFGTPNPSNYDYLKKSYDEQKAQLSMSTGYTDWSRDE
jgi:hypothetical protein